VRLASDADWAMISVWGWTLIVVTVVLAAALLGLIIMVIRYLANRMRLEETAAGSSPPASYARIDTPRIDYYATADAAREPANHERGRRVSSQVTREPSPVPPENPHAPPTPPAGLTRPGY
jgi:hypothetical protein